MGGGRVTDWQRSETFLAGRPLPLRSRRSALIPRPSTRDLLASVLPYLNSAFTVPGRYQVEYQVALTPVNLRRHSAPHLTTAPVRHSARSWRPTSTRFARCAGLAATSARSKGSAWKGGRFAACSAVAASSGRRVKPWAWSMSASEAWAPTRMSLEFAARGLDGDLPDRGRSYGDLGRVVLEQRAQARREGGVGGVEVDQGAGVGEQALNRCPTRAALPRSSAPVPS